MSTKARATTTAVTLLTRFDDAVAANRRIAGAASGAVAYVAQCGRVTINTAGSSRSVVRNAGDAVLRVTRRTRIPGRTAVRGTRTASGTVTGVVLGAVTAIVTARALTRIIR
jgi:hypothetical protein